MNSVLNIFASRHSFYSINNKLDTSNKEIEDIINACLDLYPSSFNSQDARLVLLMGEHHKYFWRVVKEELFKVNNEEKKAQIEQKIGGFEAGYGTILFFIDPNIAHNLAQTYPQFAPNFSIWAEQSNAMLQFMIWTAFSQKNIGASLQHYNPLIDDVVKQKFEIPSDWRLIAQMPFGGIVKDAKPHEVKKIADRLVVRP